MMCRFFFFTRLLLCFVDFFSHRSLTLFQQDCEGWDTEIKIPGTFLWHWWATGMRGGFWALGERTQDHLGLFRKDLWKESRAAVWGGKVKALGPMLAGISSSFNIICSWCAQPSPCHASAAGFLFDGRNLDNHPTPASLEVQEVSPHFQLSLSQLFCMFPFDGQNRQRVGKGQEIAQNPSDDPCCLGLAGWQKGKTSSALEADGSGPDPCSVPCQRCDLRWAPESPWVSISSSEAFPSLLLSWIIVRVSEQIRTFPPTLYYHIIKIQWIQMRGA